MALINVPIKEIECVTGKKVRGIVHVGASVGEEHNEYASNSIENVIWIEPLKDSFEKLKLLGILPGNKVFNCAIGDYDGEAVIRVMNNRVSSSLRELGTHKIMSPDVEVVDKYTVSVKKLSTLFQENNLQSDLYNLLVVDTQGTEDLVLVGCDDLLNRFDILFLELNINEVYRGCKTNIEVEQFLVNRGFQLVIQKQINRLQTEAIFVRNTPKTYFVIQGHTKHCDEILHSYRNVANVIWCTDEDSPKESLDKIRHSNVVLETIPSMPYMFGRINKHIASSLAGIKLAQDLGAKYVIKIRSDIVISSYESFLNALNTDGKIYSMMYVDHNDIVKPSAGMINNTTHWLNLYFQGKVKNICKFNYLTDWMFYGPIDKLRSMYENCNLSDLSVENILCEIRVLASYLSNIGKDIDLSFPVLKQDFGIIMGQMDREGIDVYSLKMQMNYSKMHKESSFGAIPNVYIPE